MFVQCGGYRHVVCVECLHSRCQGTVHVPDEAALRSMSVGTGKGLWVWSKHV